MMTTTIAAGALLALLLSGCESGDYVVRRDLSYDPAIGYHGTFDVYEPVFASELCPRGYVVLAINYRLSGRPGGTWPAQIEDVRKAVRYIRSHADELGIDRDRIALLGFSAGAHLATMAALRDDPFDAAARVRAVINIAGEHDMTLPPETTRTTACATTCTGPNVGAYPRSPTCRNRRR